MQRPPSSPFLLCHAVSRRKHCAYLESAGIFYASSRGLTIPHVLDSAVERVLTREIPALRLNRVVQIVVPDPILLLAWGTLGVLLLRLPLLHRSARSDLFRVMEEAAWSCTR